MKYEEMIELLPQYLNGSLDAKQYDEMQRALEVDEQLRLEKDFLSAIRDSIRSEEINSQPQLGWQRLKKSIEQQGELTRADDNNTAVQWLGWKKLAIAASVAFALQTGFFVHQQINVENSYSALSTVVSGNTIVIRFTENVSEQQSRALLLKIKGNIVKGPSTLGIYHIQVDNLDEALLILQNSKIIEYAEEEND